MWFEDTFLESLFQRYGNKQTWLTAKQTAVCGKYMEQHTTAIRDEVGCVRRHTYFTYWWKNREVVLNYSKLNGCGTIQFGFTETEKATAETERVEQEERKQEERILRLVRRHPDKAMENLRKLAADLEKEKGYLEEDILENDEEAVEYDRQVIGKIQKEIEAYKNAFRTEGK